MHYNDLLHLAEKYSTHIGRSEATLSNWIVGHARLFSRLRENHGCTHHTFIRALQYFSDNWPNDGLSWPEGIDRPASPSSEDGDAA